MADQTYFLNKTTYRDCLYLQQHSISLGPGINALLITNDIFFLVDGNSLSYCDAAWTKCYYIVITDDERANQKAYWVPSDHMTSRRIQTVDLHSHKQL